MKKKLTMFGVLAFVSLFLFTNCSNSDNKDNENKSSNEQSIAKDNGPDLTGNWKDKGGHYIVIKKRGDNYSVHSYTYWNNAHSEDRDYSGRYNNGKLDIGNPSFKGDITYSKESDKIYWNGKEYKRTDEQH